LVIPPNWVSAVAERTAIAIIRAAKSKRFPTGLAMAYRFSRMLVNPTTDGEEAIFNLGDSSSIVAAREKIYTQDNLRPQTISYRSSMRTPRSSST
jgi:hypothetical protein